MPTEAVAQVRAIKDFGFEGCAHAHPGKRQVLVMDRETLDALGLTPGTVLENMTSEGLNVNALKTGQRLKAGQALLEVTGPCSPCGLMDEIRTGLRKEIRGRRGTLCRVIEGGIIRRGDAIEESA